MRPVPVQHAQEAVAPQVVGPVVGVWGGAQVIRKVEFTTLVSSLNLVATFPVVADGNLLSDPVVADVKHGFLHVFGK